MLKVVNFGHFQALARKIKCVLSIKPRSHDAGMIWKRNKIITDRSPVHMMPAWKLLENGMEWKRNACRYEMKTEPFLSSCKHPMPIGFHDGATSRLISQWNKAGRCGVIICQQTKVRSTESVSCQHRVKACQSVKEPCRYQVSDAVFKPYRHCVNRAQSWLHADNEHYKKREICPNTSDFIGQIFLQSVVFFDF